MKELSDKQHAWINSQYVRLTEACCMTMYEHQDYQGPEDRALEAYKAGKISWAKARAGVLRERAEKLAHVSKCEPCRRSWWWWRKGMDLYPDDPRHDAWSELMDKGMPDWSATYKVVRCAPGFPSLRQWSKKYNIDLKSDHNAVNRWFSVWYRWRKVTRTETIESNSCARI